MLHLFAESTDERVQEQITRVLVERLIVHRPHPWGLLITFIELIKNQRYSFWAKNFTRCAPEIERLIVHRPHPWGLLITFIELIKNPRYEFWAKNFTRCAPEIERLFESVARSCMAPLALPPALRKDSKEDIEYA